jgi:hypothetical protein
LHFTSRDSRYARRLLLQACHTEMLLLCTAQPFDSNSWRVLWPLSGLAALLPLRSFRNARVLRVISSKWLSHTRSLATTVARVPCSHLTSGAGHVRVGSLGGVRMVGSGEGSAAASSSTAKPRPSGLSTPSKEVHLLALKVMRLTKPRLVSSSLPSCAARIVSS